jgi:glycosyltransferase involved in cell wall biosynthesis
MTELAGLKCTELPVVTIIILASSDRVGPTIESVLAQDYSAFNCIVVEDDSLIDFARAVAPYRSEPCNRLTTLPRQNADDCDSLNNALLQAAGAYVAIVCTGDIFPTNWLSLSVPFLAANPETIVCYPDWAFAARVNMLRDDPAPDYNFYRMVLDPSCSPGPGALIRTSAISFPRLRNRAFRLAHGYETWLLLGLQGDFIRIPGITILRRDDFIKGREVIAEYRRATNVFFRQAELPKIVHGWRHLARVHVTFFCAMIVSPHSPFVAARLLLSVSPRATMRLFSHGFAKRAMRIARERPGAAMRFLLLAFLFSPRATFPTLLRVLAKHSMVLTSIGIPAPTCEWIGRIAQRNLSAQQNSAY